MKADGRSMGAARRLRRSLSRPEAKLWVLLKGSPAGIRFRRQYAVGPYVADFYCPNAKLIIEIDGAIHDFRQGRDQERDAFLRSLGLSVVRVSGIEVMRDAASVAEGIFVLCRSGPSTTQLR